jgi:hypothetical protein
MSKFDALYEEVLNELVPFAALPALAATGTGAAAGPTIGGTAAAVGGLAALTLAGKKAYDLVQSLKGKTSAKPNSGVELGEPNPASRRGLPTTTQSSTVDQISQNLVDVTDPGEVKSILSGTAS